MSETSPRLALPYLAVAQAQKEWTHNEALALIDIAVQPVVTSVAPAAVPSSPQPGQCWIVGAAAGGAWAGRDHQIAGWTAGGWRFVAAREGMAAWSLADQGWARRTASGWSIAARGGAIAAPAGGTTVDSEARAAIAALITVLQMQGMIAP